MSDAGVCGRLPAPDAASLPVIEGKAELVSEGGQGAFGGICLRPLQGRFMCLTGRSRFTMARTAAIAVDDGATRSHADAHARDVGAGCLAVASAVPDAGCRNCLPIPAVKAEDAVGLGDGRSIFGSVNEFIDYQ